MFLTFNEQQIQKIREKIFPLNADYFIKKALIKFSGEQTVLDINLIIKDDINNSKIFNNVNARKYLKMKIIFAPESIVREIISKNNFNISTINDIIYKYRLETLNISPANEFIGDRNKILENIENNYISLTYTKKIIFPYKNIDNLHALAFFYTDVNSLVEELKLEKKYIPLEATFSNFNILPLIVENQYPSYVQDSRITKRIFEENEILKNMKDILNINIKTVKNLSHKQITPSKNPFFSNLYISKDINKHINFIFSFDYNRFIIENSKFKKNLLQTEFPEDLYKKTYLNSIKIIRKRVVKYPKNNGKYEYYDLEESSVEQVGTANINKDTFLINKQSDSKFFLEEIKLDENYRWFNVSDKTILSKKNGYYQYGIQVSVTDTYSEYLKLLKDKLQNNFASIKKYYEDTKIFKRSALFLGYYDYLTDSFTDYFINNIFPANHQDNINILMSDMIGIMKVLGMFKTKFKTNESGRDFSDLIEEKDPLLSEEKFTNACKSLINPAVCNADSILYFINIYEKIILYLNNLIANTYNPTTNIDHWFKNSTVDASDCQNVGYLFFDSLKTFSGTNIIGERAYRQKVSNDYAIYTEGSVQDTAYYNIIPSVVKLGDKDNFLLSDNVRDHKNKDYNTLEMNIIKYREFKNINYTGTRLELIDKKSIKESEAINSVMESMRSYGVAPWENERLIFQRTVVDPYLSFKEIYEKNKKLTDLSSLLLQILRVQNSDSITELEEEDIAFKAPAFFTWYYPYQIQALVQKKDKLFKDSKTFRKNVEENSKYLFFYNTIHVVEVLESSDKGVNMNNWVRLTQEKLLQLNDKKDFLCRLSLLHLKTTPNGFGVKNEFKSIELPIFDNYFLLRKNWLNVKAFYKAPPTPARFNSPSPNFSKYNNIITPSSFNFKNNLGKLKDVYYADRPYLSQKAAPFMGTFDRSSEFPITSNLFKASSAPRNFSLDKQFVKQNVFNITNKEEALPVNPYKQKTFSEVPIKPQNISKPSNEIKTTSTSGKALKSFKKILGK